MIGSGGMARAYLEAFCKIRPIKRAKVFSPTPANRKLFASEMSVKLGIEVDALDNPQQVVRGSDIVATCTDSNVAVITDRSWIEPGMHLANLNSRDVSWDIVSSCDRVIQIGTESFGVGGAKEGSERKHGWATWIIGTPEELSRIPKRGISNIDFIKYPTAIDVIKDPGLRRTAKEQVTFFHNLGFLGLQFAAVAGKAYMIAREKGMGSPLSTAPFLQSIRD